MLRVLLISAFLLCPVAVSAQTTIIIPADPAIAVLQQQITTIQAQVQALRAPVDSPAFIAALAAWEQHMKDAGKALCSGTQADTYYDSPRVYYQIADYTHDTSWNDCAKKGIVTYRDGYLVPNHFGAAGWAIFPHGLLLDWQRTNDAASHDAILQLASKAAFADAPMAWTVSADSSREIAYNIETKLIAIGLGAAVVHFEEQVEQAFDHLAQWTKILAGQPSGTTATYVRPFMVGLTIEALIQWAGNDAAKMARVRDAIRPLLDALWVSCWLADQQSMAYTDKVASDGTGGRDPSPDLNLLIAPAYAWVYAQTKEVAYREHADALFIGGVNKAFLGQGKLFNQSYRWSFNYLKWRQP